MITNDAYQYQRPQAPLLANPPAPTAKVKQQLRQALHEAHDVLFEAKTVFPFTIFTDSLVIDRTKATITHRWFFRAGEAVSIRIEDIQNVSANVGPFFGTIRITTRFYNEQTPYEIRYLWRDDAMKAKRILQGSVIAAKRQIDCTAFTTTQLAGMLDELGKGEPDNV